MEGQHAEEEIRCDGGSKKIMESAMGLSYQVRPRDDAQHLVVFVDDAEVPQTERTEHAVRSLRKKRNVRWGKAQWRRWISGSKIAENNFKNKQNKWYIRRHKINKRTNKRKRERLNVGNDFLYLYGRMLVDGVRGTVNVRSEIDPRLSEKRSDGHNWDDDDNGDDDDSDYYDDDDNDGYDSYDDHDDNDDGDDDSYDNDENSDRGTSWNESCYSGNGTMSDSDTGNTNSTIKQ